MVAAYIVGDYLRWSYQRNREGHRTYTIINKVRTDFGDGPQIASLAAGLPAVGDFWNVGGDSDTWALCTPELKVEAFKQREGETFDTYSITNTFTTVPRNRCQDDSVEDPLLEPQRISGGTNKSTKEAFLDKDGNIIESSSHERLPVEIDDSRHFVSIGQNVANLGLETFAEMIDTVNDTTLWGLAKRKVKLSGVTWERKYYGSCNVYYTRTFDFDVNFLTFDREQLDVGDVIVKPLGNPDLLADFVQIQDVVDNNLGRRGLDGNGAIAVNAAAVQRLTFEIYPESNFLLLGIPTSL